MRRDRAGQTQSQPGLAAVGKLNRPKNRQYGLLTVCEASMGWLAQVCPGTPLVHMQELQSALDALVGGLAFGLIASTPHISIDHTYLIPPVNFATFCLGLGLNGGLFFLQPFPDGCRALFVGTHDGLLRCKAPPPEVLTHGAHGQLDSKFQLDQGQHSGSAPQGKLQLQLLRPAFADLALDVQLLLRTERTATAHRATGGFGSQGFDAADRSGLDRRSDTDMPHAQGRSNVMDGHASLVKPDRLFAPLELGLARQLSSVFF